MRVFIGMSGGVDSAGAALLLQDMGHEVSGVTLVLQDCKDPAPDIADARAAAERLGIPHHVLDLRERFAGQVMDRFVAEYAAGRTPNPCIDCNREIKFGAMLDWALAQGADAIATGHYARVAFNEETGRWELLRGRDHGKDQTYVLYQLTQHQLSHLLLPVGEYEKPVIRAKAEERGLINAHKADSQDICFIPDGDYAAFLRRYGGLSPVPGDFVDAAGRVLGRHKGLECYTIGQRKGLGVSADRPLYVVAKDLEHRRLVLGDNADLFTRELTADRVNLISIPELTGPTVVTAKTRYSQKEAPAVIEPLEGGRVRVVFDQPQRAITPGQAVVFYDGERVVGGGTIL